MSRVYLNGEFMPMEEARISPMDRGFLFGEGVYEVIPVNKGRMVGFERHIQRLAEGLKTLDLPIGLSPADWKVICQGLIDANPAENSAIYLQATRGADTRRTHAYPRGIQPTLFGFAFETSGPPPADKARVKPFTAMTSEDLRWRRCYLKSTSLLGNVMHYQQGHDAGYQEVILYNANSELTEASSSNLFIVKQGVVSTPPLDHQILPGITRQLLIDILRDKSDIRIEERIISLDDLADADEVWLTSSSKEVVPVISIDAKPVNDGKVGHLWERAQGLFSQYKFDY